MVLVLQEMYRVMASVGTTSTALIAIAYMFDTVADPNITGLALTWTKLIEARKSPAP